MNCIIIDDDPIQHELIKDYTEEIEDINCVASFGNAIDFLKAKDNLDFDLLILDMEMPKMSGVDLLESFDEKVAVLVISSKKDYAIEVINHDVVGYLLKPVKFVDFLKTIEKIKTKLNPPLQESNTKQNLFIKSNGMLHNIDFKEITHISAAVDYIEVFTSKKKYLVHSTMNKIEQKVPNSHFFRIHRSTIVNVDHIKKIDKFFVEIGDHTLKIAPGKKDPFLNFINSL